MPTYLALFISGRLPWPENQYFGHPFWRLTSVITTRVVGQNGRKSLLIGCSTAVTQLDSRNRKEIPGQLHSLRKKN